MVQYLFQQVYKHKVLNEMNTWDRYFKLVNIHLIIDCIQTTDYIIYIYKKIIMVIIIEIKLIGEHEHHISYGYYSSSSTTLLTGREYQNTLLFGGMRGQRLQIMSLFLTSSTPLFCGRKRVGTFSENFFIRKSNSINSFSVWDSL